MKRILLLLIVCVLILPAAFCQNTPYWQQEVNYKIDVSLNDADHTLDGYIRMDYHNNSPDTLRFIWIHLWPNAYKNDKTAFTDQDLENGSTRFYFSNADKRGYINRLDFKVDGSTAKTEDHPLHQDIIKLLLPKPLLPGSNTKIETPFHVKLPEIFSRSGHSGQTYQVTQWYPVPAVYDRKGWHPIPYLDQGEFYAEFGNYEVQLTLPKDYVVAATGNLQEEAERKWALAHKAPLTVKKKSTVAGKNKIVQPQQQSSPETKTLHFRQSNVHDFAWFADKAFTVKQDTLKLPSGKIIHVYAYYYAKNADTWSTSIAMIKRAVITKSRWLGEYPYDLVSVVDGGKGGGMEYPTITILESGGTPASLDYVINHEVGHNWFQGILASNERSHPWMDEGMNTYYDNRYNRQQNGGENAYVGGKLPGFLKTRIPADIEKTLLNTSIAEKRDQPIATSSEKFGTLNYAMVAYTKTGEWMELLEKELGTAMFDQCMQEYYRRWQFKHPYPEDFQKVFEETSGKDLSAIFGKLSQKGPLAKPGKKDIRFAFLFNARETEKHNYIAFSPAIGYNFYDKFQLGGLIHNYTLPLPRFRFLLAPLYGTRSKQLNGTGRISYTWLPGTKGQNVELALAGSSFSADTYTDSTNLTHYLRYSKIVPSLRYTFAPKNPRSSITKFIQWKTFLVREQGLLFSRDTVLQIDIISYPVKSRYLNQLEFVIENNRVLYPYSGNFQAEQGEGFLRFNFTGNYFFNYVRGGGMNVRLFAGKFLYLGDKTVLRKFKTDPYQLNMTGPKGYEDYTYSNYFIGRNEFEGFSSQQIMMRDGGFKVGTDLLSNKIGKTDDWLIAANFTTDIPKEINPFSILPFKLPIKLFVDAGTFAEAWKKDAETARFVYDAGLQLSLFKSVLNIYVPLLYSKVYKNYYKSVIPETGLAGFAKRISFSIDLQRVNLRRYFPQLPF